MQNYRLYNKFEGIMAINKGTKGNHFVWRKYLEAFSQGNKVFVKDIKDGNAFQAQTDSIAKKNDLYMLTSRISDAELRMLFQTITTMPAEEAWLFKEFNEYTMMLVNYLNYDLSYLITKPLGHEVKERWNESIKNKVDKKYTQRIQEKLFTFYENNFYPVYKRLLNKDASFYNDIFSEKEKSIDNFKCIFSYKMERFFYKESIRFLLGQNASLLKSTINHIYNEVKENNEFMNDNSELIMGFVIFILTQHYRTLKKINSYKNAVYAVESLEPHDFNIQNMQSLCIHLYPVINACILMQKEYRIAFLSNNTECKFITSDHPVINTYRKVMENKFHCSEFELFYPLTPMLAVLFTRRGFFKNKPEVELTEDDVKEYNKLTIEEADRYIYSIEEFRCN